MMAVARGRVRIVTYSAERALFRVERGGRLVTVMEPEKRFYPVEGRQTTGKLVIVP